MGYLPLALALCGTVSLLAKTPRLARPFVPPEVKAPAPGYSLEEGVPSLGGAREVELGFAERFHETHKSVEVEMRKSRADHHFRAGALLFAKGEQGAARVEFDRALDFLSTESVSLAERARLVKHYQKLVEDIYRIEADAATQAGSSLPAIFDKPPIDEIAPLTFPIEPSMKGKVRDQIASTVSQLPLEMADPVLSFINYFSNGRGRKIFESGLERSGRYAPMIRRILDEEGLPQELIFMAQAESAFLPRAVSNKSATGMWQFMRDRGKQYGLMQSNGTDDRLDPEKATRAAARHLRDLYTRFGDWYLAIAAYNCGPIRVDRAVEQTGHADFWELYKRNMLPRETANYLPIIVAMTIMAKNPKDYGLTGIRLDAPLEYDTVRLSAATHLALLADLTGKPLQTMRELNPAVLGMLAPADYEVRVPKGASRALVAALETIPSSRRASWRVHRVGDTETVASIAKQYRIATKSILDANSQLNEDPQAGDFLLVPVSYPGAQASASRSRSTVASSRTGTRSSRTSSRTKRSATTQRAQSTRKKPASSSGPRAAAPTQSGARTYASARLSRPARGQ